MAKSVLSAAPQINVDDLDDLFSQIEAASTLLGGAVDDANRIISLFDEKLARLNVGLEHWHQSPIVEEDVAFTIRLPQAGESYEDVEVAELGEDDDIVACRREFRLGYARIGTKWALAIQHFRKTIHSDGSEDGELMLEHPRALLGAPRQVRIAAVGMLPEFLAQMLKRMLGAVRTVDVAASKMKLKRP